jgi:excisionase family DNA binding protein
MVTPTTPNIASPAVDVVDTILATYPPLLNYDQVSEITGIPKGTLYTQVHRKEIEHVRLSKRTVRFRREYIADRLRAGFRAAKTAA